MRNATPSRTRHDAALQLPHVPLLEATDLPGDDEYWSLPGEFYSDEGADDDRFARLNVARSFDD